MAYLNKGEKIDLLKLAVDLGIYGDEKISVVKLKELIINHEDYDEEYLMVRYDCIVNERVAKEKQPREIEFKKKLQLEEIELGDKLQEKSMENKQMLREVEDRERQLIYKRKCRDLEAKLEEIKAEKKRVEEERCFKLKKKENKQSLFGSMPKFDRSYKLETYLIIFERSAEFWKVDKDNWGYCLMDLLTGVFSFEKIPVDKFKDYSYIKNRVEKAYEEVEESLYQSWKIARTCYKCGIQGHIKKFCRQSYDTQKVPAFENAPRVPEDSLLVPNVSTTTELTGNSEMRNIRAVKSCKSGSLQ